LQIAHWAALARTAWQERSSRLAVAGRRLAAQAFRSGSILVAARLTASSAALKATGRRAGADCVERIRVLAAQIGRSLAPGTIADRLAGVARAAFSPARLAALGLIALGGALILIRPALTAGLLLLGLDLVLPEARTGASAASERHDPPPQPLIGIPRPVEIFDVPHPERRAVLPLHEAFRHPLRAFRRDRFTFGEPGDPTLFLALALTREPGASLGELSLADQVAEPLQIERARLATTGRPLPMPTKLGDVSVADAVLDVGAVPRACLAFVLRHVEVGLDLAGLACGAVARPVDRMYLRCFIERITLNGAGLDQPLQALFQAAEKRRDPGCDGPSRILAAGHKPTWLDSTSALPKLKTLSETVKKRAKRRGKRKHSG
jgi:hypothetical protein